MLHELFITHCTNGTLIMNPFTPEHVYEKGLLSPAKNSGGIGESSRCWTFFVSRPQVWVLANKDGGGINTIYHLQSKHFGGFQVQLHAFWAV